MNQSINDDKAVRFYVSAHKPVTQIDNDVIRTVQQKDLVAFLRGGTEEDRFMAERANEYCELLTQYWAWKYETADYYGFGHYRRFFSFNERNDDEDVFHIVCEPFLGKKAAAKHKLDDCAFLKKEIAAYDVITPIPYSYDVKTVYDQYRKADKLHVEDLDLTLRLIEEFEPDYAADAKEYMQGNRFYICNMFFMKKDLFFDYSRWLFGILRKFYERRDMNALHYNAEAMRTPGHLGERLFGIYLTHLEKQKKYAIAQRNIVSFQDTEPNQTLKPAFSENNVPIFMATNAYYAKFTAAALCSIAEHVSDTHNYDIIVLHNNLKNDDADRLRFCVRNRPNIKIRFFNPERLFESYNLYESATITKETYYRLIIPEYFPYYDKALYLDSDMIVLDDVAKLYDTEIGDNLIAGAVDLCHAGNVNGFDADMRKYYEQFRFKNIYGLINAGVLILNTAALRREFSTTYLLDFANQGQFRFQDQDLLNILCEDRIFYLDARWNFFADPDQSYRGYSRSFAPKPYLDGYQKAKKDIRILHFAGNEKPWFHPDYEYAFYFWNYFRLSPYYEYLNAVPSAAPQTKPKERFLIRTAKRLCPKGTRRRAFAKKIYLAFFKKKN